MTQSSRQHFIFLFKDLGPLDPVSQIYVSAFAFSFLFCSQFTTATMGLYLLDYGAGNVQSLANSLISLGYTFEWIKDTSDFAKATVSHLGRKCSLI